MSVRTDDASGMAAASSRRRDGLAAWLLMVGVAGMVFQVAHLLEHLLQAGYWTVHPEQAPWLTPWAAAGRDVLAAAVSHQAQGGSELLHLLGNVIFLAALGALAGWQRLANVSNGGKALRWALGIQALHVAEHVLLTLTWLAGGQALGVTTAFGAVAVGTPPAHALRVLSHFLINAGATWAAVVALHRMGAGDAVRRWPVLGGRPTIPDGIPSL